jgi:uncharacterized membrane protein YfcA
MKASNPAVVGLGRIGASSPLGFLIGLSLGTLGGGGSILAVPALVYGAGEAAHAATTTSLVVVGSTALVGMVGHFRAGRVRLWAGLGFGLVGIGGSFIGSALNRHIPGDVLLLAFSGLILIAAWRMHQHHTETPCHTKQQAAALRAASSDGSSRGLSASSSTAQLDTHGASTTPTLHSAGDPVPSAQTASSSAPPRRARATVDTVLRVVVAGTAVGFLTGFFGVGGGFVIVPALVLALGYAMPNAVGTSLLVIAVSSAEGLVFRLSNGGIDWRIALPFTIAGIIGVLLGDRIAGRVPAAKLTLWFVWLLVAVAAYTAAQSLVAL